MFFKSIPSVNSIKKSRAFPDFWISTAQTAFWNDERQVIIAGSGCSKRRHKALTSAYGEMHEHLWSQPAIQIANKQNFLRVFGFDDKFKTKITCLQAVGIGISENFKIPKDATGIAFGKSLENAISHAILEIVERHLISMVWLQEFPMTRLDSSLCIPEGYSHTVLISEDSRIPFAMSFISGDGLICAGAKCACDWQTAIDGAISETIMIHDNYINPSVQVAARHAIRMARMRDQESSNECIKFIKKITPKIQYRISTESYVPGEIFIRSGLQHSDSSYVKFFSQLGACVRVSNSALISPYLVKNKEDILLPLL